MKTKKIFTALFTLLLFTVGAKAQESVTLHANEDPDHNGVYYTTFYDSQHGYAIPDGVTAYIAEVSDGSEVSDGFVILRRIDYGIVPRCEAVILRTYGTSEITMYVTDDSTFNNSSNNMLDGVDKDTEQDGSNYYMLSYGQYSLSFYKMDTHNNLAPHKAFIKLSSSSRSRALRITFSDK